MDSSFSLLFVLFAIVVLVGIVALTFQVKKKQEQDEADRKDVLQTKMAVQNLVSSLPQDKQMAFMIEYNSRKKDSTTAVLLAVFLGAIGAHKFYLGETVMGVLYLLFSWTYIPGIIGIIEAFSIGKKVERMNAKSANEIAMMLGVMNEKGGQLPLSY